MKKILPLAILVAISIPNVHAEDATEDTLTAGKHATGYAGLVIRDSANDLSNKVKSLARPVGDAILEGADVAGGFLSDLYEGGSKKYAISAGDGVTINARVYSLALRDAVKKNSELKMVESTRKEVKRNLEDAIKETDELKSYGEEYKDYAVKFQKNASGAVLDLVESTRKLAVKDKALQEKLDQFIADHKKIGSLTAEDGNARIGSHTLVSMNETLAQIKGFIERTPEAANSEVLKGRFNAMTSLLANATKNINDKEQKIATSIGKINFYSQFDDKRMAEDEEALKRQIILGTLNNSVNNLITNAEFSKVRSQLAFAHFNEIEKEMKGVKAGDVKDQYKKNIGALSSQYNNTPFGVYVNSQIAKAMGSVCELVNNQCKEGTNASLFDFLDDTNRSNYKAGESKEVVAPGASVTK